MELIPQTTAPALTQITVLEVGGSSGSICSNALLEKGHPEPRWLLKISIWLHNPSAGPWGC